MKKLWTCLIQSSVLAAGLVCSADVFAQQPKEPSFPPETPAPPPKQGPSGGHHGMMDPDEQLARMTTRYSLTTEQQDQVKPILVSATPNSRIVRGHVALARRPDGKDADHSKRLQHKDQSRFKRRPETAV